MIIIIINSYTFVTLIKSTYERFYAIYIEWAKLSEIENHLLSIQLLHAVETIIMRLCIKLVRVDCMLKNEWLSHFKLFQKLRFHHHSCSCLSKNILHTLHATYIRHDLYADFSLSKKYFFVADLQFKMNEISHCSDFNSLLLKHELQMFRLQYACILQLISSLITLIYITVFLSYTDDVFD